MVIETVVAHQLKLQLQQVQAVLSLLDEGATIPFIARYRKDKTGALDEVVIAQIQDLTKQFTEIEERRNFIEKTITEQGKITDDLLAKIKAANSIAELEDIYLPYKPKRKTKAQTAKENGLEPLSVFLLQQTNADIVAEAEKYINETITNTDAALQGARDIIAEQINQNATTV
jgi:protein Tex